MLTVYASVSKKGYCHVHPSSTTQEVITPKNFQYWQGSCLPKEQNRRWQHQYQPRLLASEEEHLGVYNDSLCRGARHNEPWSHLRAITLTQNASGYEYGLDYPIICSNPRTETVMVTPLAWNAVLPIRTDQVRNEESGQPRPHFEKVVPSRNTDGQKFAIETLFRNRDQPLSDISIANQQHDGPILRHLGGNFTFAVPAKIGPLTPQGSSSEYQDGLSFSSSGPNDFVTLRINHHLSPPEEDMDDAIPSKMHICECCPTLRGNSVTKSSLDSIGGIGRKSNLIGGSTDGLRVQGGFKHEAHAIVAHLGPPTLNPRTLQP